MLDRLRQGERLWDDPARTSPFAAQLALAIGSHQDAPIAMPARTPPVQFALVGPLDRSAHRVFDQVLTQRTSGAGDDEATVAILHQASPALSLVRFANCPLFFCTN